MSDKTQLILFRCFTKKYDYYVIACHPTEAKKMVEAMLREEDHGFSDDREVIEIKQITKQIVRGLNSKYFLCGGDKLLINI